ADADDRPAPRGGGADRPAVSAARPAGADGDDHPDRHAAARGGQRGAPGGALGARRDVLRLARGRGPARRLGDRPGADGARRRGPRRGEPYRVRRLGRAVLGGMYCVSQAVEVPRVVYVIGRVPTTRGAEGKTFDWSRMLGALLRVRFSAREPAGAYVAVYYRG